MFEDVILDASRLLANVEICNISFEGVLKLAKDDNQAELPTFFYFDPYKPLNDSSSFTSYAKDSFDDDDQVKLKEVCDLLTNKVINGCSVIQIQPILILPIHFLMICMRNIR